MEINHFERSIVVQSCHAYDPATIKLKKLLVIHFVKPKIDLSKIFFHLYPNSI